MEIDNQTFLISVYDTYYKNDVIYYFTNLLTILFVIFLIIFLFSKNLERRQTIIRSVPPLLLSLGIFGTFFGIFLGLINFDTNKLNQSILLLLDGLKIAFFTSIVGMAYSLAFRGVSLLSSLYNTIKRKAVKEEGVSAEDLLLKLSEIKDSISGEQDSSLFTQIQKLRTDTTDNLKELNSSFKEFAKEMSENNTKALIEAIEQVMKDFNTKINEQIGDNFRRLNEGVEALVKWQDNYKEQVEKMVEQFNIAGESIEKSKDSMTIISEKLENVPKITEQVKDILETNQNQISNLEGQLDAFSKMKDNAVEAMPLIEKRLNEMTEAFQNSVSNQLESIKTVNENMKTSIESSNEAIKNSMYEQLATIKTVNEDTKSSIESSNEAIKSAIQSVVDETSQKLVQQIEALDKQMSEELSRALELMGSKLTSLSNQFVKDYEPLTKQLSNLVKSMNRGTTDKNQEEQE